MSRRLGLLICCGLGLIGLTVIGLMLPHAAVGQFGIGYGPALTEFVALACLQGLIYAAAVAALPKQEDPRLLSFVIGTAILLRLMIVAAPPFLSNDMYRYVWDGWVQAAGINPYRYLPVDTHLGFLRDSTIFPNINRATYAHTIYPPAAEIVFLASAAIDRILHLPPVLGLKLAMLVLEGAAIWAMLRLLRIAGLPRQRILVYAWNPLPIWEFAGSGHVDAVAVCFIALALLAAVLARPALAALALAVAVLSKFIPVILLPAIWRRWDWRFAALFTLLIAALYAPYLGVGRRVFGFLGGYGAQEGLGSGRGIFIFAALRAVLPLPAAAAPIYLLAARDRARRPWRRHGVQPNPAGVAGVARRAHLPASPAARRRVHARHLAALPVVLCVAAGAGLHRFLPQHPLPDHGQLPTLPRSRPYRAVLAGFALSAVRLARSARPSGHPHPHHSASPSRRRRVMSSTLSDPRRYFETVGPTRGAEASAPPVCLYLEVTSRCNLLCETCPRAFEDLEPPRDMRWELFTSITRTPPSGG